MAKLTRYLALIVGVLSPILALRLYSLVYTTLTRASTDREKDWLFRLAVSTVAMTLPFFATVALAWVAWRQRPQEPTTSRSAKRRQQRSNSRSADATPTTDSSDSENRIGSGNAIASTDVEADP